MVFLDVPVADRVGQFYIFKLVKPLISAALCLLRLGGHGGLWWVGSTTCRDTRWFIRYGRCILHRQLFFSSFLRAFGASYFFSICRLKPLAACDTTHLYFAHARLLLYNDSN